MRKIKKPLLALCAISLLATAGFTACTGIGNSGSSSDGDETVLIAPEILVSGEGIKWAEIENASVYSVKLNDGEWTETQSCSYEFPSTVGEYTLSVVALDADGQKGEVSTFDFAVAQYEVSAVVSENSNVVVFDGTNVMYKVNDEQDFHVLEEESLDFSAVTVGTAITVSYYAAGNHTWDEATSTYYVDGSVKTVGLTVCAKLDTPTVSLNSAKDGLVWEEVANAVEYKVTVDGVANTVSATSAREIKFPQTAGAHTIKVQAVGNGTTLLSSDEYVYEMTTEGKAVPKIQFNSETETVSWAADLTAYVQLSENAGGWQAATGNSVTYSEGLRIKTVAHYNEVNKTFVSESLVYGFATRENPIIDFDVSGLITWNEEDVGTALTYEISKDGDTSLLSSNAVDVRDMESGVTHTLTVKALEYLSVTNENATFYFESSETEIEFSVLPAPTTIGYQTGKLTWAKSKLVSGYQVKKDNGDWVATTAKDYTEIDGDGQYQVRALGKKIPEQGVYLVTSKACTLNISNTKFSDGTLIDYDNLNFNEDPRLAELAIKNSADADRISYDETEHALKVADTLHSQHLDINFPSVRLTAGDSITLTMKVVKTQDLNPSTINDGGLELNSGMIFWKDVMTEEYLADRFGGGKNPDYGEYVTFTYSITKEFILTNIKWRPYSADLITVYLQNITLNRPWALDETEFENVDFSGLEAGTTQPKQLSRAGVVEEVSGYGKALKTSIGHNAAKYDSYGLKLDYSSAPIVLQAGDTVTAEFYGTTSSVCFYLHFNGSATYSKELFVSKQKGAGVITYTHMGAEVELTQIGFATWSWDGADGTMDRDERGNQRAVFYLKSVVVEKVKPQKAIEWTTTETETAVSYKVDFSTWTSDFSCADVTYNGVAGAIVSMDVNGTQQNVLQTNMNTTIGTMLDFSSLNLAGKKVTFKMTMRLNEDTNNNKSSDIYVGSTWLTGNYGSASVQWMTGSWKECSFTATVPNGDVWKFIRQGGASFQWEQKMYIASIEIIVEK